MGKQMQALLMAGMVLLCLTSTIHATPGIAVYYKPPYTPSKCYGMQDKGPWVAGVSDALWNNGAACGTRYSVRCTGGANLAPHPCNPGTSVVVTVVDYCKNPCVGIINLSQQAFSQIADTQAGKVNVEFDNA